MGGGPTRDLNFYAWGVDLAAEQLRLSAGLASRPVKPEVPLRGLAERSVNAAYSGVVERDDFLEGWRDHPNVSPLVWGLGF